MDLIKIGKYIAGKRKSLGMTQKQLAEKLGMSDKSVSKWERGVCLPDVSVYKELCSILGISLNEFLAGEDIAQENMIQKSETNIIEVIRDNIDKQKCLKVMKCILLVISICAVSVIGFTIYRLKKPQNYISPVAKDSIEMQTAELLAGPDGAFVYKFITTDEYKKLRLHIYRYESGKLSDQDKVEMGFEDIGSPKSGEIVMVPDFDNYVIKLIISGGGSRLSTEIPILENVENREYYGRTATEIKNVVDIRYDKQQPLIAFVYDNDEMSVPTLDDFINSQTDFLSKNDYVSYVDKESEHRIVAQLRELVPEAGFIAEEGSGSLTDEEYCWLVDPLDGTTNFIHNNAPYCISIALRNREELLVGVVYEVCRNELYWTYKGSPSYLNGREIHVSDVADMDEAFVALGFPYNFQSYKPLAEHIVHKLYGNVGGLRLQGAAAAELCYVAAGRFEARIEGFLGPWDIAAGSIILMNAGGKVTDYSGGENFYNGHEVLATNGKLHNEFLKIVGKR